MNIPNLFKDKSQLANLGLSPLHRAYLGLSRTTFEEAFAATTRPAIDRRDATGRTTLSWVCARGDRYTAIHLVTCGADPNKLDKGGMTPLHWSRLAHGSCCMTLLAAKAAVNQQTRHGETAATMLARPGHSEHSRLQYLKLLASHGADLEHANKSGRTLLMRAGF